MTVPTSHVPVLADEVLHWLQPAPGSLLVDGTLGGGGHARRLAEAVIPGGRLIAVDRDPQAVASAASRLLKLPIECRQANYCELPSVLQAFDIQQVDGILLDLGLSSDQLADAKRGFSFAEEGPLDLRFDVTSGPTAADLVNQLDEQALADLIYRYGEERLSRRIARRIVEQRSKAPIDSSLQLAQLIRRTVRGSHRIHPATRTFQALRIAVNEELASLELALERLPDLLRPGGRLAIISFHSLEDRPVKWAFRNDPRLEPLTRRPIRPSEEETTRNRRARSAKLRVAEKRGQDSLID